MPKVTELQQLYHAFGYHAIKAMLSATMAKGGTPPAGPGEILGLQDLLLERELESSIVTKSNVVVWRVPSKALKAILRIHPDLSLHLFRLAFGKLEDRTEQLQVSIRILL
jgi:hypothetical protein